MFSKHFKQKAKNNNFFLEKRRVFVIGAAAGLAAVGGLGKAVGEVTEVIKEVVSVPTTFMKEATTSIGAGIRNVVFDPLGKGLGKTIDVGGNIVDRGTHLAAASLEGLGNRIPRNASFSGAHPTGLAAWPVNTLDRAENAVKTTYEGIANAAQTLFYCAPKYTLVDVPGKFITNTWQNISQEGAAIVKQTNETATVLGNLLKFDPVKGLFHPIKSINNATKQAFAAAGALGGLGWQGLSSTVKLPTKLIADAGKATWDISAGNVIKTSAGVAQGASQAAKGIYATVVSPFADALPSRAAADDYFSAPATRTLPSNSPQPPQPQAPTPAQSSVTPDANDDNQNENSNNNGNGNQNNDSSNNRNSENNSN